MIKAEAWIEFITDEKCQPTGDRCQLRFECPRTPVVAAHVLVSRGQVLAVNYSEIEQGVVRATFDAHARVYAIVWCVPRGAKKRK